MSLEDPNVKDAADVLADWATRAGRTQGPDLAAVNAPRTDVLYRLAPESLCIPGYDDKQEGDPDRNALPLEESMVMSIMAIGVIDAIQVQRRADGAFEVISGRRRTRHAREANRRLVVLGEKPISVPVVVKAARLSSEMASVIDATVNEHRYNDPMPVKMRKARKMRDRGIDLRTIAVAYRVEPSTVQLWITAMSTHADVQAALEREEIGHHAAVQLASMPLEAQPAALQAVLAAATKPIESAAAPAPVSGEHIRRVARAVKKGERAPVKLPRDTVKNVLAQADRFPPDFIEGIRFVRGELPEERIRAILAMIGR